jgi:hypothetical protein
VPVRPLTGVSGARAGRRDADADDQVVHLRARLPPTSRIDAEVDEEVRFHVEQEIAAQVARGVEASPSEARQDVYTSDR